MDNSARSRLDPVFKGCFFCGIVLFAMGNVMSFVPGAEVAWFLCCVGLLLPGLLLSRRKYTSTAAILMVLCLILASQGHRRGLEYLQWEQTRSSAAASQH